MKITKGIYHVVTGALLLLPILATAGGCGADTSPVNEDPKITQARVDTAKEIRSYFDKSGGNYDSLSPEDKEKVNKLMGGEENAKKGFGQMGTPVKPGTAPASGGGLAPSGPGNLH